VYLDQYSYIQPEECSNNTRSPWHKGLWRQVDDWVWVQRTCWTLDWRGSWKEVDSLINIIC